MTLRYLLLILGVTLLAVAVACGTEATSTSTPVPAATSTPVPATATLSPEPTSAPTPLPTATPEPTPTPTEVPSGTTHNVDLTGGNRFVPSNITISAGDTIKWTVTGSVHTTTSGQPGGPGRHLGHPGVPQHRSVF